MNKKRSALFILSILLILMAGCETVKGAFEGAKKDWQSSTQAMQKADGWIRENLW